MKKADLILVTVVAAIIIVLCVILYGFNSGGSYAAVEVNGVVTEYLPLNNDAEFEIKTDNGFNKLIIKDGKAFVSNADCKDKICVHHLPVYRNGESIICLPHKVVITIQKDKGKTVDAVS